jgi:hypothetical protein
VNLTGDADPCECSDVSVLANWMGGHRARRLDEVCRRPAGAPWADLGRDRDSQEYTQTDRADEGPLPRSGAANLTTGPPVEVSGCEARRVDDVAEHVNGHGGNPHDEGGLVEEQKLVPHAGRAEQQGDAGAHDRDGEYDE